VVVAFSPYLEEFVVVTRAAPQFQRSKFEELKLRATPHIIVELKSQIKVELDQLILL